MPKIPNPFATHVPVLKAILAAADIKTVVEFGPGHYSTDLFVKAGCKVLAIEQQNYAWFDRINREYEDDDQVQVLWLPAPADGPAHLAGMSGKIDLVFVDGEQYSRVLCIEAAFKKTSIIIAHDTEDPRYGWDKLKVPKRWKTQDFVKLTPITTVWATQKKIVEAVRKAKEG